MKAWAAKWWRRALVAVGWVKKHPEIIEIGKRVLKK